MSRPLEARVMSVVGSRGTRDRCPCHVRGRLPRDRRPSTVGRVVLNAPHEMPPPHHRPSWDSWIRPSLTDAPPSPVRQKSVASPWQVRRAAAAHLGMSQNVGNRRMPAHQKSVACPSPVRTKPVCVRERRRSEGRTRGKRRRDAALIRPRREPQANAARAKAVCRPESVPRSHVASPWFVRHASIARTTNVRCSNRQTTERRREHSAPLFPHVARPYLARSKSVCRPCRVRVKSVPCPSHARVPPVSCPL